MYTPTRASAVKTVALLSAFAFSANTLAEQQMQATTPAQDCVTDAKKSAKVATVGTILWTIFDCSFLACSTTLLGAAAAIGGAAAAGCAEGAASNMIDRALDGPAKPSSGNRPVLIQNAQPVH